MKKISCLRLRFLKMMQVIYLKVTILNWKFNNIIRSCFEIIGKIY